MESMKELLDRLKRDLGDDWHEKLAWEMSEEDRQRLREALDRPPAAGESDGAN